MEYFAHGLRKGLLIDASLKTSAVRDTAVVSRALQSSERIASRRIRFNRMGISRVYHSLFRIGRQFPHALDGNVLPNIGSKPFHLLSKGTIPGASQD